MIDAERSPSGVVVSSAAVTLDDSRQLEVFVLWGPAGALSTLAGRIVSARGVLSAELSISCAAPPRPRGADAISKGADAAPKIAEAKLDEPSKGAE